MSCPSANDFCKENKRTTLSAEDVIDALRELEFDDLIEPLKAFLEQQKVARAEKAASKKAAAAADAKGGEAAANGHGENKANGEVSGDKPVDAAESPEAAAAGAAKPGTDPGQGEVDVAGRDDDDEPMKVAGEDEAGVDADGDEEEAMVKETDATAPTKA